HTGVSRREHSRRRGETRSTPRRRAPPRSPRSARPRTGDRRRRRRRAPARRRRRRAGRRAGCAGGAGSRPAPTPEAEPHVVAAGRPARPAVLRAGHPLGDVGLLVEHRGAHTAQSAAGVRCYRALTRQHRPRMRVTRYGRPMSLLERAIEAHGGAERWAATEALDVALHARGPAFTLKGRRGRQVRATLQTDRPLVTFRDFPASGRTGVFDAGRVRIDGDERSAADARTAAGRLRWDDLGELYFDGYALWQYMTAPFGFTA